MVIGLIGGIGSGKSRVAAVFAAHGACVISGDEAGHEALRRPDVREQVVARWGRQVLDEQGEVSRRRLGQIVFADLNELRALEAIVFPWIERRLRDQVEAARGCPLVVLDAAVLLEAGWNEMCDRIVYVHAPRAVRLRRLAEQRGWTAAEVEARERAQLGLPEKAGRATDAVDNSGSLEQVTEQVKQLLGRWGFPPAQGPGQRT